MPELTPFPALRFSSTAGDLSHLLAPPYDVIDPAAAADLRARSPYNTVRLILPEGSDDERYTAAADTLTNWLTGGVLEPDPEPAAYVYRQEFETETGVAERCALFAAVRLAPLDEGEILPHEHTHAGPKKDRLALTLATRTQLSPVFMVAHDADGGLWDLQRAVTQRPSDVQATTPDGIRHSLWVVADDIRDELLASAAADPLLIADGHHRYETALAAREILSDSAKAAHLLVCVVSQRDPGLVVRPTHRVLAGPPRGQSEPFDWVESLGDALALEDVGELDPEEAEQLVAGAPAGSLVVATSGTTARWLARARPEALAAAAIPPERARIAPVVFDELVLRRLYSMDADEAAREGILSYSRGPATAATPPSGGCGFILPAVSLEDVWATAARGGRLPPKSTYFEPKMPSGLLFRRL
ncbi:MAG: DUF1015 domain-containing protein [marine benthic group bacterium]|nr:DUF1015 domain-containing protein [Candidatus Benthicola marisminoris]